MSEDFVPSASRKEWARFAFGIYFAVEAYCLISKNQSGISQTYEQALRFHLGSNFFINDLNLFFFLFRFNNNNFRFRLNFRLRSGLGWCDGLLLIFVPPVFPSVGFHSKQSY